MKMYLAIFSFVLSSLCCFAQQELTGIVSEVIDGNTIKVVTSANDEYKLVFSGIDSPEMEQEFGDKARRYLERQILSEEVTFKIQGKDRLGNYLAIVLSKGEDLRIGLLREGLAWTAERNPLPELETYRQEAAEKGKGLWKQENPTPPWIFRREQSMLQPKSS